MHPVSEAPKIQSIQSVADITNTILLLNVATCLLVQDQAATRWPTWNIFRPGFAVS